MKRRAVCFITAFVLAFSGVTTFAQETDSEDAAENNVFKVEYLQPYTTENAVEITVDEAVEKAINESKNIKNYEDRIEDLNEDLDEIGDPSLYDYGISYSEANESMAEALSVQNDLANAKISQNQAEEEMKYSILQAFINIIEAENELTIAQRQLQEAGNDIVVERIKYTRGLINSSEMQTAEASYKQQENAVETMKRNMETTYENLCDLLGDEDGTVYKVVVDPVYESIEDGTMNLDDYIRRILSLSSSVEQQENNVYLAETRLDFRVTGPGTYDTLKDAYSDAQDSLQNAKDSVEDSVKTLYNNILSSESSYEVSLMEFENKKLEYEQTGVKYERGLITENEMEAALTDMMEAENSLLTSVYDHMLNMEKINNPYLF